MISLIQNTILRTAAVIMTAAVLWGCSKDEQPTPQLGVSADRSTFIARTANGKFLSITTPGEWSLQTSFGDGDEPWCTVAQANASGTGDHNVWVSCGENTAQDSRRVRITVTSGTQTISTELIQFGTKPPVMLDRMELPVIGEPEWVLDYTNGRFMLEYSTADRHCKWVAWQLYLGCLGSEERSEAWAYDGRIPSQYRPGENDFRGYDRGHMCPSADRTKTAAMNRETFYYTNMSPQDGDLNRNIWADLEIRERNWVKGNKYDTLFICAGGTLTTGMTLRKNSTQITIPAAYFKAVLRKKSNGQYDAIGFWFDNRAYGSVSVTAANTCSIDELETRTGFDFFYNLPTDIQTQVELRANPSDWGITN